MEKQMSLTSKWAVVDTVAAVLATADAFASVISRTACNHENVPNPQIVEVDYLKPGRIIPCRVFYTKNNRRRQKGEYNINTGGCERIEKNIATSLVNGGFICSHSVVGFMDQKKMGCLSFL